VRPQILVFCSFLLGCNTIIGNEEATLGLGGGGLGGGSGLGGSVATGGAGGDVSSGGGAGGSLGGAGSGTAAGGSGGQGCGECDLDCDTFLAEDGDCGGDDCSDTEFDVHPGQTNWFEVARMDGTFDYDCDGDDAREFETIVCEGALGCGSENTFLSLTEGEAACGALEDFGDCSAMPITCKPTVNRQKIVRCR
jgi:hypothetical protein